MCSLRLTAGDGWSTGGLAEGGAQVRSSCSMREAKSEALIGAAVGTAQTAPWGVT